jgi:GcrA cell cycle regulator
MDRATHPVHATGKWAEETMQSDWPPAHCRALREFLASGLSYGRAANAINAKFETRYSRSATIGRARRMGLMVPGRPEDLSRPWCKAEAPALHEMRERRLPWREPRIPFFEPVRVELRRAAVEPRHLSFLGLERGDCRYPYGGDAESETITFCGHARRPGSSYCTPHFDLTRGAGTRVERAAVAIALRLVRLERQQQWRTKRVPRRSAASST